MQLANLSISVTSSTPPAYPCGSPGAYIDYADPLQAPYPASSSYGPVALSTALPADFPSKPCGVVDSLIVHHELGNLMETETSPVAQGQTPVPLLENVQTNTVSPVDRWASDIAQAQVLNRELGAYLRLKGYEKQAARLVACGEVMGYHKCANHHVGELAYSYCNQPRLCVICAKIQRMNNHQVYGDIIKQIKTRPVHGYQWRFITLPVRTSGDFAGAVKTAQVGFKGLWNGLLGGKCKKWTGALVALEFGGDTGNVHLHVLYYGPFITQDELSGCWEKLTGSAIVDIRLKSDSTDKLLAEVLKYIGKPGTGTVERRFSQWRALNHKRVISTHGLFRADVLSKWLERPYKRIEPSKAADRDAEMEPCAICGDSHWRYVRGRPKPMHDPDNLVVVNFARSPQRRL